VKIAKHDGIMVKQYHVLQDGDVIELYIVSVKRYR